VQDYPKDKKLEKVVAQSSSPVLQRLRAMRSYRILKAIKVSDFLIISISATILGLERECSDSLKREIHPNTIIKICSSL
jgi:hypothetical protein